jgi:succinate-acetate transporter protein
VTVYPSDGTQGGAQVRIVLRPLGSALPLGFFAFGVGMVVLAGVDIPLFPQTMLHAAAALLLTFVAPLEILAAVFAFLARDGMAGTGLALFAASWATFGVQDLLARPGATSPVLGLYLITFAVVVVLLGIVAVRGQPLLALVLLTSAVRTALAGSYEVGAPKPLFTAAGILALVITLLAFYGAVAFLLEDTAHRTLLPLGRRGQARTSLHGDLDAQLSGLDAEAGVRRSL